MGERVYTSDAAHTHTRTRNRTTCVLVSCVRALNGSLNDVQLPLTTATMAAPIVVRLTELSVRPPKFMSAIMIPSRVCRERRQRRRRQYRVFISVFVLVPQKVRTITQSQSPAISHVRPAENQIAFVVVSVATTMLRIGFDQTEQQQRQRPRPSF